ncbi:NmrA family NAD(P)-binding protein [Pseudomonas sp. UFMG81]|uniref:NmrA family NAD(P)-binding protein n=1 Tax=Pseudomonas sp. UFMG81 TaxID=2745936 RepID=UPI00188DE437|nr:NmrA family NAD(P)-binding protein [Pseudomonas sp. UFMG81]
MSKALIIGATGNLTGLTAERLYRASPDSLRVATSRPAGLETLAQRFPGAEVVLADWNDEASLVAAMQGVSRLLVVTPDFFTDENVATSNIISAAKKAGSIELVVRLLSIPPGLTADQLSQEFLDTRCGANLHVIAKPLLDASGLPVCYVNVPAWIMFNLHLFLAAEVKLSRRIAMPAATQANRMWVSEHDIADVMAKILSESVSLHVGREYVLTSPQRYGYSDVAEVFSAVLEEDVTYAQDDEPLRNLMGDAYETLMTYFRHETKAYGAVVHSETLSQLLGRPQQTLHDYIKINREAFQ